MQQTVRPNQTFLQSDEDDIQEEGTRFNEWNDVGNVPRTVLSPTNDRDKENVEVNKSFQAQGNRRRITPSQIQILKKGDHVGWHRWYVIWHHAIVLETDSTNGKIKVIHFTEDSKTGSLTIIEEWIVVEDQGGDFFLFDYPEHTIENNHPEIVLQRAKAKLGETGYKLLENNCEHIATYCKTGQAVSHQVHWAKWKGIETAETSAVITATSAVKLANKLKELGRQTSQNVATSTAKACAVTKEAGKQTYKRAVAGTTKACTFAKQARSALTKGVGKQGSKSVTESTVKVASAETVEKVSRTTNWVGAGLVAALEIGHCAYDIYKMNENRKDGKITDSDFNVCATQRVGEGIGGGGLSIAGSLLGEKIGGFIGGYVGSAVPVLGTAIGAFVGSVVGGVIGSVLGKACGSIVGNWFGAKLFFE